MVFETRIALSSALVAAGLLLVSGGASAQLLYCCTDQKKIRQCGDSLPTKCIGLPYTIRGREGRLVREVPAPLTPEQFKAKEELDRQRQQDEAVRKEQVLKDKALLATYSNEAEIDKARERAENEVNEGVLQTQSKLEAAEKKKATMTDRNTIRERLSPEDQKKKAAELDHEIATLKELLESKKKDQDSVRAKFAEDKQRYLEIRSRSALPR